MTRRTPTLAHLHRGDRLTAIAGDTVDETVTRVERDGDTVRLTTGRGPKKRRVVRLLPASLPVTTDPPIPAWRFTDRPRPAGQAGEIVAAIAAGAVLGTLNGILGGNRRPQDDTPIIDIIRERNAGTGWGGGTSNPQP